MHDLVVDDIRNLTLEAYIGSDDPRDVIVFTDSGDDNKKMHKAIVNKHWQFLLAVGNTRSVQSARLSRTTSKAKQWCHMAMFLRNHRWLKWNPMRSMTTGTTRKRMACRVRDTLG